MTIKDITHAGAEVLRMLDDYKGVASQGELGADRVLFGLLQGRFRHMSRQHRVRAGRIDFRFGTSNPVVIEFAFRAPRDPRTRLFASQNRSELRKLTRVRPATARMRVLLLLDRSKHPIPEDTLRKGYDEAHAGVGRFQRHTVRVIYVHKHLTYNFRWYPHAESRHP